MNKPQTVRVDIAQQPKGYDILIGTNLLAEAGAAIRERVGQRRCLVITDENVAPHYLKPLETSLEKAGLTVLPSITVPAGESSKSLPVLHELMNKIFERKPDRKTLLIALGGGVIGDLVGFAASILLRAVDFVQVPTSLLAQVDSSVGGKTGINSLYGKNTIGAFYQPKLVLADIATLRTLPKRELLSGYGEATKYGLIMDEPFFAWCETNGQKLIEGDEEARAFAVQKSCAYKAQIVSADELEAGKRALLNMGHTFAHPLESLTGYGEKLLHGEAVAMGSVLAFRLSAAMGLCAEGDANRIEAHNKAVGLPLRPPSMEYPLDQLMDLMAQDKKARDGKLTLILANGIGQAFVAKNVDEAPIRNQWQRFFKAESP